MKDILNNLKTYTDKDLILLRFGIDDELQERGINLTVGSLGEKYCIDFFNETPGLPNLLQAPTGAKNVDALSRDGDRYSIKTFKKAKKTGTIYPDSNDPDKQLFEYLVIIEMDIIYRLCGVYRYSWEELIKVRAWDKRMNAWYVPLSKKNLNQAEVLFRDQKRDT